MLGWAKWSARSFSWKKFNRTLISLLRGFMSHINGQNPKWYLRVNPCVFCLLKCRNPCICKGFVGWYLFCSTFLAEDNALHMFRAPPFACAHFALPFCTAAEVRAKWGWDFLTHAVGSRPQPIFTKDKKDIPVFISLACIKVYHISCELTIGRSPYEQIIIINRMIL